MMSLDAVVEIGCTKSDENKMHIDGDETKTPEETTPFKSKVRDHANRASFKTSPTWSNCRRTANVANTY